MATEIPASVIEGLKKSTQKEFIETAKSLGQAQISKTKETLQSDKIEKAKALEETAIEFGMQENFDAGNIQTSVKEILKQITATKKKLDDEIEYLEKVLVGAKAAKNDEFAADLEQTIATKIESFQEKNQQFYYLDNSLKEYKQIQSDLQKISSLKEELSDEANITQGFNVLLSSDSFDVSSDQLEITKTTLDEILTKKPDILKSAYLIEQVQDFKYLQHTKNKDTHLKNLGTSIDQKRLIEIAMLLGEDDIEYTKYQQLYSGLLLEAKFAELGMSDQFDSSNIEKSVESVMSELDEKSEKLEEEAQALFDKQKDDSIYKAIGENKSQSDEIADIKEALAELYNEYKTAENSINI